MRSGSGLKKENFRLYQLIKNFKKDFGMEKNALQPQSSGPENKGGKGCMAMAGCLIFFIVLTILLFVFFFAGLKTGFFDSMLEGFKEKLQNDSVQNGRYMKPRETVSGGEMFENRQDLSFPASALEKKGRMEALYYVYLRREQDYEKDFPEKIAGMEFKSDAEAAEFLKEELVKGKYKKNELDAIKNRLDLYMAKAEIERLELELAKARQEKEDAGLKPE